MLATPAEARADADNTAWSCEAELSTVASAEPFQLITDWDVNPLPFTFSVSAPVPTVAPCGEIDVMSGCPGATMSNGASMDEPPPVPLVTTLTIASYAGTLDERIATVRAMADIAETAGVLT